MRPMPWACLTIIVPLNIIMLCLLSYSSIIPLWQVMLADLIYALIMIPIMWHLIATECWRVSRLGRMSVWIALSFIGFVVLANIGLLVDKLI